MNKVDNIEIWHRNEITWRAKTLVQAKTQTNPVGKSPWSRDYKTPKTIKLPFPAGKKSNTKTVPFPLSTPWAPGEGDPRGSKWYVHLFLRNWGAASVEMWNSKRLISIKFPSQKDNEAAVFGFIKQVDKGRIISVKAWASWRFGG